MQPEQIEELTGESCGTWRRLEHRDALVCDHDFMITGEDLEGLRRHRG